MVVTRAYIRILLADGSVLTEFRQDRVERLATAGVDFVEPARVIGSDSLVVAVSTGAAQGYIVQNKHGSGWPGGVAAVAELLSKERPEGVSVH